MLCPNPVLSVSHSVDTLFTCGPCILGAAINTVIGRYMQDEFEIAMWTIGGISARRLPRMMLGFSFRAAPLFYSKTNKTWAHIDLLGWSVISWWLRRTFSEYDNRPPTVVHYSKTHLKVGIYGLQKLYKDSRRANEQLRVIVKKNTSSLL